MPIRSLAADEFLWLQPRQRFLMSFWLSIQLRGKNIQLEKYAFLSTSKPGIVGRRMADDSSQSHTPAIPPPALTSSKDYVDSDQGICNR
jgi:hypothetical protein